MYVQEAVNELVDIMRKPKFAGKLVIILAGYDNDMNNLLRVKEGLSSRFADEITFPSLNLEYCLQLLSSKLEQSKIQAPALNNPRVHNLFDELTELPVWGIRRDIQTLAKSMVRAVYKRWTAHPLRGSGHDRYRNHAGRKTSEKPGVAGVPVSLPWPTAVFACLLRRSTIQLQYLNRNSTLRKASTGGAGTRKPKTCS
jgi:hypothetical protein